jgi:hypothetical protein
MASAKPLILMILLKRKNRGGGSPKTKWTFNETLILFDRFFDRRFPQNPAQIR